MDIGRIICEADEAISSTGQPRRDDDDCQRPSVENRPGKQSRHRVRNARDSSNTAKPAAPRLLLGGHLVRRHVHLRHVLRGDDRPRVHTSHRGTEIFSTSRARAVKPFLDFAPATRAGKGLGGELDEVHPADGSGVAGHDPGPTATSRGPTATSPRTRRDGPTLTTRWKEWAVLSSFEASSALCERRLAGYSAAGLGAGEVQRAIGRTTLHEVEVDGNVHAPHHTTSTQPWPAAPPG